jgi:hypothetical protein
MDYDIVAASVLRIAGGCRSVSSFLDEEEEEQEANRRKESIASDRWLPADGSTRKEEDPDPSYDCPAKQQI